MGTIGSLQNFPVNKEDYMAKYIVIDEDECVGCESCVELCPEAFEFDESTGIAKVVNPAAEDDCVEEAMESCPADCIRWEED